MPGDDEYLCLQAVHALATALYNNSGGDAPLAEAAGAQGAVFLAVSPPPCICRTRGLVLFFTRSLML